MRKQESCFMKEKIIYITDSDMRRLRELIKTAREFHTEDEIYLKELEKELNRSKVVDSKKIPKDIITMNTKVCIKDLDTNKEEVYWLVFPADADTDQNKISILTPIGTALLGYKTGDIIEWEVPGGISKLKIKKLLYQPEAPGNYKI